MRKFAQGIKEMPSYLALILILGCSPIIGILGKLVIDATNSLMKITGNDAFLDPNFYFAVGLIGVLAFIVYIASIFLRLLDKRFMEYLSEDKKN